METRVTIKDIALRAGVSPGTVDRVIHGRGNVSPEARAKVEQAMGELHYEPNIFASTLAYNRTLRVFALLPDYRQDPYWELPKSGVEQAAHAARHFGVHVELFYHGPTGPGQFEAKAMALLDARPDALLIAPLFLEASGNILQACAKKMIPVALINTDLEDRQALCYVGQDSFHSGALAGKLLQLVLRPEDQVAVLNLDNEIGRARHLLEKERGLRHYFQQHGYCAADVLRFDFEHFDSPQRLKDFLQAIFQLHPRLRGLFVTNSRSYLVLDALGPEAPAGLRIVGFDLLEPNLRYLEAERIAFLINQNPAQQGFQAVMSIVDQLIFRKKVERVQYLPLDIVVAENASYYLERKLGG
jgi:LacI family transcriptional regulator